jgi:energy-coupling factor transporter transmembrane protein EcfT
MTSLIVTGIIILVVIIVFYYLLFKLAKKAAKWVLFISIALLIISTFFGINLLNDAKEFQEEFPKAQKLFILKDDNQLLAGFEGKLTDSDEVVHFVTEKELTEYQQAYDNGDLETIRGDNFKLFITDASTFDDTQTIDAIQSENTLDESVTTYIQQEDLTDTPQVRSFIRRTFTDEYNVTTDQEARGLLFVQMYSASGTDPSDLIIQLQSGDVIVYPETITFKVLEVIPPEIVEGLVGE